MITARNIMRKCFDNAFVCSFVDSPKEDNSAELMHQATQPLPTTDGIAQAAAATTMTTTTSTTTTTTTTSDG